MGCATSKQKKPLCRNCQRPCSPMPRSYSMHVQHPPERQGDSYHAVPLTSTTLGSLLLPSFNGIPQRDGNRALIGNEIEIRNGHHENHPGKISKEEFEKGVIEAKTWSEMINEKIPKVLPKTPIQTPPGEPETINAWELMEGLDDVSPLKPPSHVRCFSFHVNSDSIPSLLQHRQQASPTAKEQEEKEASPKPTWMEMADSDSNSNSKATSVVSEFDPDVISAFRKTMEELPPTNPFHLQPLVNEKQQELADMDQTLEITDVKKVNGIVNGYTPLNCRKDKVIVYFTSLRGVRKTYEDCCHVMVILKGLGVRIDERDVSMHSGFKEELKGLLGDGFNGGGLPRVFVGKRLIGGADEIRRMHEDGQLEKLMEECEMVDDCSGGKVGGGVCEACGDIRFVPCETCSGSCKIYYDDDDEEYDKDQWGFKRCPNCNENGLIRCPVCCD